MRVVDWDRSLAAEREPVYNFDKRGAVTASENFNVAALRRFAGEQRLYRLSSAGFQRFKATKFIRPLKNKHGHRTAAATQHFRFCCL